MTEMCPFSTAAAERRRLAHDSANGDTPEIEDVIEKLPDRIDPENAWEALRFLEARLGREDFIRAWRAITRRVEWRPPRANGHAYV
jgi:hypothetical protein